MVQKKTIKRRVVRASGPLLSITGDRRSASRAASNRLMGKTSRAAGLFFLVFLLIALTPAFADGAGATEPADITELSIEELAGLKVQTVFGASKFEQKLAEAPSSVSIVTADEIKKYGYRTLADVLQGTRSFYTTYDRSYRYAGVRGFGLPGDFSSRILILVDGHRTNDDIFLQGYIGTDFILDLDLVDRIEIIRGPGSSLYGTNAFFGVVNIITKRARDMEGLTVSGEIGSNETYKGIMTYGRRWGTASEIFISGSLYDSEGDDRLYFPEFDDPENNDGIAVERDDDHAGRIFGRLNVGDLTLHGGYVKRKKGAPAGAYEVDFNDHRNSDTDERGYIELLYQSSPVRDVDITARLSYDFYKYFWTGIFDGVENHDKHRGEWWSGELSFVSSRWKSHTLSGGAEFQYHATQKMSNYDEFPPMTYTDVDESSRNWAVYIEDQFEVSSSLRVNAGIRYDNYDTFGGTLNPRVALVYDAPAGATLKILYGRAFRAPSLFELYLESGPSGQKSSPDLEPEVIHTYEVVLEKRIGKNLRGIVSGFYNKIDDLVLLNAEDRFENSGSAQVTGVECELEGMWEGGFQTQVSYSYQDGENTDTGDPLPNSPRHMVRTKLIVPVLRERLFAGAQLACFSDRKTIKGGTLASYCSTDLTLFSKGLVKGLEASASLYNLFDSSYADPVSDEHVVNSIKQDGRTFRVKLTYTF